MANCSRIPNSIPRMESDGPCRWSRSGPMPSFLARYGSFPPTTVSASIAATSAQSVSMKRFDMQNSSGSSKTALMAGFVALDDRRCGLVRPLLHAPGASRVASGIRHRERTGTAPDSSRLLLRSIDLAGHAWSNPILRRRRGNASALHRDPVAHFSGRPDTSLGLAAPDAPHQAEWALPIGLCLTALLPTGVVNPLTVAGVLFPGLGWAGLIATIILFGTLSKYRVSSLLWAAMLAANLLRVAPRHSDHSHSLARPRHRTWRLRTVQTNANGAL